MIQPRVIIAAVTTQRRGARVGAQGIYAAVGIQTNLPNIVKGLLFDDVTGAQLFDSVTGAPLTW